MPSRRPCAARPVRVPLPDEPQGEALAFTPDGTLLSGSESRGGATGQIRAVPGAARLAVAPAPSAADPGARPATRRRRAAPAVEAAPAWRTAAIGAAALVAVLGVLAAAMARARGSAAVAAGPPAQSLRSTATTRPSTVASSPGIGS